MQTAAQALPEPAVVASGVKAASEDPFERIFDLPCTLVLEVPVVDFNVGVLMKLRPGSIVRTATQQNEDLPLLANGQQVGTVEFDVLGERLAVRLLGMA